MAAKLFVLLGLVAASSAGLLAPAYYSPSAPSHWHGLAKVWQPAVVKHVQPVIVKKVVEAEAPANYDFNYAVNDHHTGDVHSQHERAENGAVKGSYQLNDADGFLRTVDYTADAANGFQANVRREPLAHKQVIVKKIVVQPQGWSQGWQQQPQHGWQQAWQQPQHGWQQKAHGWQ